MSLKEEIGGIIYDADIYKKGVTTGQLNNIVDEISKSIVKRIDMALGGDDAGTRHMLYLFRRELSE